MIRVNKEAIFVSIMSICWVVMTGGNCQRYSPNTTATIICFGDSITYGSNEASNPSDYPTFLQKNLHNSWYPGCLDPGTTQAGFQQGCVDNAGLPGEKAADPCSLDSCTDTCISTACNNLLQRITAIPPATTVIYWEGGNDLLTYGQGTQPPHPVFCNNMGNPNTSLPSTNQPPFNCLRKRMGDCINYIRTQLASQTPPRNVSIILGTYYKMDWQEWTTPSQTSCVTDVKDQTSVTSFNRFIVRLNDTITLVGKDLGLPVGPPAGNLGIMPNGHIPTDVHPNLKGNKEISCEWCKVLSGYCAVMGCIVN